MEKFSTHNGNYYKLSTFQNLSNLKTVAIEQNNDVILQQLSLKTLKVEYPKIIFLKDNRKQHYSRQLDRHLIQDEIITRQYFDEAAKIKYNKVLLPKHLVIE